MRKVKLRLKKFPSRRDNLFKVNNFKKISEYLREEIVEFRLEVMEFTEQHGVEVIKKPFDVSKSTI
jgi:hypothetical protein